MTVSCTHHCGVCGRHFHSQESFDAHRAGSFSDPENGRRCQHPLDVNEATGSERFMPLTETGACRVYREVTRNVVIWTLADSLQRARERFGTPSVGSGGTLGGPRSVESDPEAQRGNPVGVTGGAA